MCVFAGQLQVWSWDITWLPAAVKGKYYYWYMMLDVFR
ncbi:transposase InsO family protein [Paraburkholderia sp. MM6662-R1]